MLAYLIVGHLNETWRILLTYQLFQGLCCECRKEADRLYERSPGAELRADAYKRVLLSFMYDLGLSDE